MPFLRLSLAVLAGAAGAFAATPVIVETGEIDGAKFALARPAGWNRRVLLLAPGMRPEGRPLVAELFPDQPARRALLAEGWIIAATSYRRSGLIVADALADLDALRAHIAEKFGPPERVLLEGDSLGGFLAVLVAERDVAAVPLYHGALAIGAALDVKENSTSPGLTRQPRIPLLFLSNHSEFEGPRLYVESRPAGEAPERQPALFRISRDGHVNVNQPERLAAVRALNLWLDRGRAALPRPAPEQRYVDLTVPPAPQPSRVALHADGRGLDARVTEVSAAYGNVLLDAQPADLAAIGLGKLARFQLIAHGQAHRVTFGFNFDSVKRGEWVVFANADGFLLLARNWGDAAAGAGLAVGDRVTLRRFETPR